MAGELIITLRYLTNLTDVSLLLLRLMVGIVFFSSGWNNLADPDGRSKSIDMSKGFTIFLGILECGGALGVAAGVLTQLAAIGLILIMLGAIEKKLLEWQTGFWGKNSTDGWSYDLLMIAMSFVIATTAGGRFVLEHIVH